MHVEKGLSLGYFQDIFLNVIFSCTLCYLSVSTDVQFTRAQDYATAQAL